MTDIPFIFFSLFVVVFNIAPWCWQIEHKNAGPICLGFWIIAVNLVTFVNAVVWRHDAINRAPIWCDISVKIYLGGSIGTICANICIARFLASILSPSAVLQTARDRRRRTIFDYSLCFGLPLLVMAAQIVYQPSRFAIAEARGCLMTYVITWPTYVLWLVWIPALAFIGALYSLYVIYRLIKHRAEFRKNIASASSMHSSITVSRFLRLLGLSIAYLGFQLPLSIYTVIELVKHSGGYIEYSWSYIHGYFYTITYVPFVTPRTFPEWFNIITGLLLLVFFGFAGEATSYYTNLYYLCGGKRLNTRLRGISPRMRLGEKGLPASQPIPDPSTLASRPFYLDFDASPDLSEKDASKSLDHALLGNLPIIERQPSTADSGTIGSRECGQNVEATDA